MTKVFQCAVLALIVAFCFGTSALAAEVPHHWSVKVVPGSVQHAQKLHPRAADTNGLYSSGEAFVATPFDFYASENSDGSDVWPCFGGGTSANSDCPTIGDPAQDNYSVAIGSPAFTYSLAGCDATSTSSLPCGQTNTWYEDDSLDSTDDLTYLIEATQGTTVIADSGTVDFGPNPYGVSNPGFNIIIYGDQAFGTEGQSGVNNGECSAAFNYPLASAANPGAVYVIPAGKTCHAPVSGLVTLAATTELGTPKYTKKTSGVIDGTTCSVAHPCYTVTYTKKFSLAQKWTIWLD
jgi:hypothetical protein